jgi:hypothetical protein
VTKIEIANTKPKALAEVGEKTEYPPATVDISDKDKFWMWKGKENEPWKVEALKLASEVSNNDLDFIRKITAENGHLAHDKRSTVWLRKGADGKNKVCGSDLTGCWRENSWGYCQLHVPSQPEYYTNPDFFQNRIFTDKEYQMKVCYEEYMGGTAMYAEPLPASEFYLTDL